VFATSKRLLDGINPDTLLAVHNLGLMYRNQERYLEAEQMYKRVLEGREKQYDPDHTITLGPVHTLTLVYENMWRNREVEEVYRRVQEKRDVWKGSPRYNAYVRGLVVLLDKQKRRTEFGSYGGCARACSNPRTGTMLVKWWSRGCIFKS